MENIAQSLISRRAKVETLRKSKKENPSFWALADTVTSSELPLVLIAEDDAGLAKLLSNSLKRHDLDIINCAGVDEAVRILSSREVAFMVLDFKLKDGDSRQVISLMREKSINVPFVVLTGRGDEQLAVEMLKMGAADYLVKNDSSLEKLPHIIQAELKNTRREKRLNEIEKRLLKSENISTALLNTTRDASFVMKPDGTIIIANELAARRLELPLEEVIGKSIYDLMPPLISSSRKKMAAKAIKTARAVHFEDTWNGRAYTHSVYPLVDGTGRVYELAVYSQDVTDKARTIELIDLQRDLAVELSRTHELKKGLELCFQAACTATGFDCGGVFLLDEQGRDFKLLYYSNIREQYIRELLTVPADSQNASLIAAGKPIYTNQHKLGVPLCQIDPDEKLQAVAAVPIVFNEKVLGAINIASHSKSVIPDYVKHSLETIAALSAGAISRLRTENILNQTRNRLTELIQSAQDVICIVTASGEILYYNGPSSYEVSTEQVTGRNFLELYEKEQAQKVIDNVRLAVKRNMTVYDEIMLTRRGADQWFSIQFSPVRDEQGDIYAASLISRNITEKKAAEQQLMEAKSQLEQKVMVRTAELTEANILLVKQIEEKEKTRLLLKEREMLERAVIDSTPAHIAVLDSSGTILAVNSRWEKFARENGALPSDAGPGVNYLSAAEAGAEPGSPEAETALRGIRDVLERKSDFFECEYKCPADGQTYWYLMTVCQLKHPKGGAVISHIDITDQKKAKLKVAGYQQKLRSLASELTINEQRQRKHIAQGLHDSIIQSLIFLKIKLDSVFNSPDDAKRDSFDEMKSILDELIQRTRNFTLELSSPMLYELGLAPAAEEWLKSNIMEKHGIDFEFNCGQDLPDIENDLKGFLFQAFRELLVNVVKHSAADKVWVGLDHKDGFIELSVRDNGCGFVSQPCEDKISCGFGLFSIRERFDSIGGSVKIDSVPGQGTSVIITAPLTLHNKMIEEV